MFESSEWPKVRTGDQTSGGCQGNTSHGADIRFASNRDITPPSLESLRTLSRADVLRKIDDLGMRTNVVRAIEHLNKRAEAN